jgi:rSAM/selenodomain-associated transferase 1
MPPAILLFLKNPVPGRVKTRIAATLGPEAAAAIYRLLVRRVLENLPKSAELVVVFDPPESTLEVEGWIRSLTGDRPVSFWGQTPGDLGERLLAAFSRAFRAGYTRVAAVGSDCVEIPADFFDVAWRSLEAADVVLGPAVDGGYYLIALKRDCPGLFSGIPWSSERVFELTCARARAALLGIATLPPLEDVDTERDWNRVRSRCVAPGQPEADASAGTGIRIPL